MNLFLPCHYAAFQDPKPTLDDSLTRTERVQVRDALLELDEMLWPFIKASGWDLHRHRRSANYVSSHHFVYLPDGTPIVRQIGGMWLHYGKSPGQLDFFKRMGGSDYRNRDLEENYDAFYHHTRIQFFLGASVFRCWLLLATDKSAYDREEFLDRRLKDQAGKAAFYNLVHPLVGKGFFYELIDVSGERTTLQLDSELTQEDLISFVKRGRQGFYSGIVKEYQPDDPALDRGRIREEMVRNLEWLYPVYEFMAWRSLSR